MALLIDNTIYTISFACLPHLFEDMRLASKSKIGLVMAMFGIGSIVTSTLAGIISDRWRSRKLPLVIGSVGYVASGLILGLSHKLWHVLLYRLLNGMASGLVYPITTASAADVRPKKLLGLQMSLLNMFNNAGYMIGKSCHLPCGLYAYSAERPHLGPADLAVVVTGGVLAVVMAFVIKEPLEIHSALLSSAAPEELDESCEIIEQKDSCSDITIAAAPGLDSRHALPEAAAQGMPLWRLVIQWQVLSASIIALSLGVLTGSLDNVLAMDSKDRFGISASKTGLLYTINGGTAILLSMPVGSAVDWIIGRYGEAARASIVSAGLFLAGGAVLTMGLSTSFGTTVGVEAWLSAALLL
ncbi:hypothetical protein IWQ56_003449, partial [Coemansia nantahalensis]